MLSKYFAQSFITPLHVSLLVITNAGRLLRGFSPSISEVLWKSNATHSTVHSNQYQLLYISQSWRKGGGILQVYITFWQLCTLKQPAQQCNYLSEVLSIREHFYIQPGGKRNKEFWVPVLAPVQDSTSANPWAKHWGSLKPVGHKWMLNYRINYVQNWVQTA